MLLLVSSSGKSSSASRTPSSSSSSSALLPMPSPSVSVCSVGSSGKSSGPSESPSLSSSVSALLPMPSPSVSSHSAGSSGKASAAFRTPSPSRSGSVDAGAGSATTSVMTVVTSDSPVFVVSSWTTWSIWSSVMVVSATPSPSESYGSDKLVGSCWRIVNVDSVKSVIGPLLPVPSIRPSLARSSVNAARTSSA